MLRRSKQCHANQDPIRVVDVPEDRGIQGGPALVVVLNQLRRLGISPEYHNWEGQTVVIFRREAFPLGHDSIMDKR